MITDERFDVKNPWIRKTIMLKLVSPVHIGTREGKITALEYFYHREKVHLIDEEKFTRFLLQRKWIDLFVQEASRGPLSMERFFRDRARIDPSSAISQVTLRSINGGNPQMQDFRSFIRDAMGRVFLPGTSLKGVFRTALLYRILKKEEAILREVTSTADSHLQPRLPEWKKKKYSETWLQRDLLQNYSLPNAKKGPNTDILRCLSIRDAYAAGDVRTEIIPIRFLSRRGSSEFYWSQRKKDGSGTDKDLQIWVEALTAGKFLMEIGWDQQLFETFRKENHGKLPLSGLEDLLSAVHEMNRDLCSHEKDFFQRKVKLPPGTTVRNLLRVGGLSPSEAENAAGILSSWYQKNDDHLFRLGFGSGMLSTTVNLLLPEGLRQRIRDACGHPRPGDAAPKSRRVWKKSENEFLPLGWLKME